jgi:catechol 2,3-dioxygenase-like lactoylglutathione lyase family enzyme
MNRFHVHVGVTDIDASIRFYSTLFAAEPTVRKPDYAKWMLENPRVNFAISHGRGPLGIHHLGIQAEDRAELDDVYGRLERADRPTLNEGETVCCYAKSEKSWVTDPQGISWETFLTQSEHFGQFLQQHPS